MAEASASSSVSTTPSSSSSNNASIELLNLPISTKLNQNNFLDWQSQIVPLLHEYELFKYVESPNLPSPTIISGETVQPNPDYLQWHEQDQLLLGWLRSSLSEPVLDQVVLCTTSAALWSMLHQTSSDSSNARVNELQQQLQGITKGESTCAEYIQKLRSIADELAFIGAPVPDNDLVNYTLRGLGPDFNPLVFEINARSEPISLPSFHSLLLTTETRLNSQHTTTRLPATPNPRAFYSNPRPRYPYGPYPNLNPRLYRPPPYRFTGPRPNYYRRPNYPGLRPPPQYPRPNYYRWPSNPGSRPPSGPPQCARPTIQFAPRNPQNNFNLRRPPPPPFNPFPRPVRPPPQFPNASLPVGPCLVPHEVRDFIFSGLSRIMQSRVLSEHTITIKENEGLSTNQVFDAVRIYLASRVNTDMQRLRVSRVDESKSMIISMKAGEEMLDSFEGIDFKWKLVVNERSSVSINSNNINRKQLEMRSFELNFHKEHKDKALNKYLPFILERAKEITEQDRTLKIYMNNWCNWVSVDLHHPSTFDTLAIDSELKQTLMDDLARFVKGKDYYKRIGKAWKRGYLLYGPPGTGKSSLVAAMANYLKFNVYDLDLTKVMTTSNFRTLLIRMSNHSILLIEDIDCMVNLNRTNGNKSIKLSGLLNFIDGIWSSSGEERIIVLTTNYKERLDQALTRPGRMDMHIHMGYCGPCGFRVLARNYHSIDDHELFPKIEGLLKEVEVTPADVAEMLMKSEDGDVALNGLVEFFNSKKGEKVGPNVGGLFN
ncbi:hypothetical protein LUZ61_007956 [Rhynchospora tenuis]|uniref:AAA+ ATPase domain-containing protein n=1 Tax=Rhynchospora tenuis TaxID=198213 RepID=A0AAD5ZUH0_9POAL|nr:hypothetical protein LUZ61_007956 [Rhynchospora tenuis]